MTPDPAMTPYPPPSPPPPSSPARPERPTAITVICILGFIGAAFTVPLLFLPTTWKIAPWYAPYLGAAALIGLTCMLGLWKLRRWAVVAYTTFAAINQIVLIASGLWNPLALGVPAAVVVIGFYYWKRLT
ncbi:MAG: hypothetical protein HY906_08240 [Deltaproteobacteria bacterium]|nr:hypothetical protein [Deltaproteobacteria bacterium]